MAGSGLHTAPAQHPTAVTSIVNSVQDTTLEVNYNGSLLMTGEKITSGLNGTPNDSIPVAGSGVRMMWYPAKGAFRAGSVGSDEWNATNIGKQSVAFGESTTASGRASAALGFNTVASEFASTAIGSKTRAGGTYSFAAGRSAKAKADRSFVWNSENSEFTTSDNPYGSGVTGKKTFHVKAVNGIRFITGATAATYIPGSSTGWTTGSSRTMKTDISVVDPARILAAFREIPISTWEYKTENGRSQGTRHIGPMAEDFHGALPYDLGTSKDHINTINADGVAFAAIKGLAQRVERQQATIDSLKNQHQQVEDLRKRVAQLEAQSSGSLLAGFFGPLPEGLGLILLPLIGGLIVGLLWRGHAEQNQ
jgi:hypothetical protein